MSTAPHNKLIEEKVSAVMQEMYTVDGPDITDEQADRIARSILTKAMSDLLATRDAQMIEAVENLPSFQLIKGTEEQTTYIDVVSRISVLRALRPQQQEEVCAQCDKLKPYLCTAHERDKSDIDPDYN